MRDRNARCDRAQGVAGASAELDSLPPGVLDPAIHAVFLTSAAVAVTLVLAAALMPRRVEELSD